MNALTIKAKELLKNHSPAFVLDKMTREKQGRTTVSDIKKAIAEALK